MPAPEMVTKTLQIQTFYSNNKKKKKQFFFFFPPSGNASSFFPSASINETQTLSKNN